MYNCSKNKKENVVSQQRLTKCFFLRLFHLMNVLLKMLNGCYILNIVHILLAETVDTCSVVAHTILLVIIYNSLNSIKDNQILLI